MDIKEIVDISITRETTNISQAGFGTLLIVGPNVELSSGRLAYFTNAADAKAVITGTDPYEADMVDAVFAQNPSVVRIALGTIEVAETYPEALTAILLYESDWYGLACATRDVAEQKLIADWTETNKKFYGVSSADTDILDTPVGESSTIAGYVKENNLERTFVIYNAEADTKSAECAYFGKFLVLTPGSYTCMFKKLSLITADDISSTKSTNALDKNCNLYQSVGGTTITMEGKVGSGEFMDIIIFIDWLQARIQETVFIQLVNAPKIPFTNAGITIFKNAIEGPLDLGQVNGGISPEAYDEDGVQIGGYRIEVPKLQDVPLADRTARFLDNVKFTAWLAGAIHKVKVNGVVTL